MTAVVVVVAAAAAAVWGRYRRYRETAVKGVVALVVLARHRGDVGVVGIHIHAREEGYRLIGETCEHVGVFEAQVAKGGGETLGSERRWTVRGVFLRIVLFMGYVMIRGHIQREVHAG